MTTESKPAMAVDILNFVDKVSAAAVANNDEMVNRFISEAEATIFSDVLKDQSFFDYVEELTEDVAQGGISYEHNKLTLIAKAIARLAFSAVYSVEQSEAKDPCHVLASAYALHKVCCYDDYNCGDWIPVHEEQMWIKSFFIEKNVAYVTLDNSFQAEKLDEYGPVNNKRVDKVGEWGVLSKRPEVEIVHLLGTAKNNICIVKTDAGFEKVYLPHSFAEKYQLGYPPPDAIKEVLARK